MRFSKIVIAGLLIFLAVFTVAMSVCAFIAQYEPSALITCVFAFAGAEGGALAMIKIFEKDKEKSKDENGNDRLDDDFASGSIADRGGDIGFCDPVDQEEDNGGGTRAD